MEHTPTSSTVTSKENVKCRIIRTLEEFIAIRETWNELADHSEYPNIFTTWEWCSIWWKWFGKEELKGELFLLVFESDDQIVGLFPLYRTHRGKNLRFLGYGARPSGEYLGPILRKGWTEPVCKAAMAFFQENKKEWNSLFFESYALDDPGTSFFAKKMKEAFPSYCQEDEERFYITLPETYDSFLRTLSSHNRSKKKNRLNQAKNKFEASFCSMMEEPLEVWYSAMVELLKASRDRLNQQSPYDVKNYYEFQKELLASLISLKHVDVSFLKFKELPVAVTYSFIYHGKCYFYQPGYASDVKGSPGDVSMQMLVMNMIEKKCTEFDFLRGGEWYKSQYTDTSRKTERLALFSGKNHCYYTTLFIDRAYRPFRRMVKRLLFGLLGKGTPKEKTEPENKLNDT